MQLPPAVLLSPSPLPSHTLHDLLPSPVQSPFLSPLVWCASQCAHVCISKVELVIWSSVSPVTVGDDSLLLQSHGLCIRSVASLCCTLGSLEAGSISFIFDCKHFSRETSGRDIFPIDVNVLFWMRNFLEPRAVQKEWNFQLLKYCGAENNGEAEDSG